MSANVEQLMMHDPDPTTDVEHRCVVNTRRFQLIEKEPRCFVRSVLAIAAQVAGSVLFTELRLITLT